MCDISFPKDIMLNLWATKGLNFIWIDHHKSAIEEMANAHENISSGAYPIRGMRDYKFSACELTWFYFFTGQELPEIIRLLGRYDSFGHKGTDEELKVIEFQYGARSVISNYKEAFKKLVLSINANHIIPEILGKGKDIYQYLCTEAKQIYKNGFPLKFLNPHSFGKNPESEVYDQPVYNNFLCINRERFNPINFGIDYHKSIDESVYCIEKLSKYGLLRRDGNVTADPNDQLILKYTFKEDAIKKLNTLSDKEDFEVRDHMWTSSGYDGVACFWYENGHWNFSLYNDNGEVDCSVIAKQYGGGGHSSASGFIVKDLKDVGIFN